MERAFHAMGTEWWLRVEGAHAALLDEAQTLVAEVEAKLSRFRDDSAGSASPTKFTGTWGAGETFSAFVWKDIVFDGTNTAQFLFDSLTDHALVQNVVGDCNVSIRGNATGRINVVSCDAVSLCASSADVTSQIQYYGCHISSALNQPAASEKIVYHGTIIDGQERNNLSNTEPSNTRPTLTLNGARIFGGVDSLTDLGTSAVDLNGGRSFGNGVVHFRIRTIDSHQGAFSLYIGFESGTAVVATTTGAGNCTVTPTQPVASRKTGYSCRLNARSA